MPAAAASTSRLSRRWRTVEHAERRRLIIEVALDLLRKRGLEQVTMRRVAHRLGVGAMTLYTYVDGQDALRRELTRVGFAMIHENCRASSTLATDDGWLGGARAYLRFALENPNLYNLMFSIPLAATEADKEIFEAGFQPLIDRVKDELVAQGHSSDELEEVAARRAAVYWTGLHGLATLAIAGRLECPECKPDDLLKDLLARIAPT